MPNWKESYQWIKIAIAILAWVSIIYWLARIAYDLDYFVKLLSAHGK